MVPRNQFRLEPLVPVETSIRETSMSNQNQNPGQQDQNPGRKPGQQQQGGGQKPGQQQQDPNRRRDQQPDQHDQQDKGGR